MVKWELVCYRCGSKVLSRVAMNVCPLVTKERAEERRKEGGIEGKEESRLCR